MNFLWAGMVITAVICGICTGNTGAVSEAVIASSKEAVMLVLGIAGVIAMWCGIMEVMQVSGLTGKVQRGLRPVLGFLFPGISNGSELSEQVALNMTANIIGLGWAATPAGLRAMEMMKKRNRGNVAASDEMCTFLVINMSSLQLIPMTVIAFRSQYGSMVPAAIIGPGIVATAMSTLVAVVFCRVMCRKKN